ncbi:MAG: hypothetical protein EHM36_03660 [Deltaproteobacteria bacterium]|nr:MAG: hypothetical protein EHM36_03660 [Deltaproteobacteria bacterium]
MVSPVSRGPQASPELKAEAQKLKLKEACQEFEAMLNGYLFKSMRQSIDRAEEPDQAQQVYEGMMDETLARELSKHGNGSLSEILYHQLLPLIKNDTRGAKPQTPPSVSPQE